LPRIREKKIDDGQGSPFGRGNSKWLWGGRKMRVPFLEAADFQGRGANSRIAFELDRILAGDLVDGRRRPNISRWTARRRF
jgi:hypothetical protein